MTEAIFSAEVDRYLQAAGMNAPPPAIASDPLVSGLTPAEQLLRVLGLAANADDPSDSSESIAEQAARDAGAIQAAEAFAAGDELAAGEVTSVAGTDPATQFAQQIPQTIAGIAGAVAGAVSGALGGALQSLGQIPQQVAALAAQTGTASFPENTESALGLDEPGALDAFDTGSDFGEIGADGFEDGFGGGGFGDGPNFLGGSGSGGGSDGGSGPLSTAATGLLGPPPVPSAGTAPASAPPTRISPPGPASTGPPLAGGMAGMPMIPPGAMQTGAAGDRDAKTDTKRVSVPPVRNGAPVQGRLIAPPAVPVVKVTGKPVATKRITAPDAEPLPGPDPR